MGDLGLEFKDIGDIKSVKYEAVENCEKVLIVNNDLPVILYDIHNVQFPTTPVKGVLKREDENQFDFEDRCDDARLLFMSEIYNKTKEQIAKRKNFRQEERLLEMDRQQRALKGNIASLISLEVETPKEPTKKKSSNKKDKQPENPGDDPLNIG